MSTLEASFRYTVNDISTSVRGTNALLRGANAVRLLDRDIKGLLKDPSIAKFFWTAIQVTRAYRALRRIYILTMKEINKGTRITKVVAAIPFVEPMKMPEEPREMPRFNEFTMRADAFLDNRPITLDKIDLTNLPMDTSIRLQQLFEREADQTVSDMQQILRERIIHQDKSTGFLEASIGWMPQVDGIRLFANAYYSAWVEEGHDSFTGHWFMQDAIDLARQRLPEEIREELNELILNDT